MKNDQTAEPLEFLIKGYATEPERVAEAFLRFLKDKKEELDSDHSWMKFLEEIHRGTQVNLFAYKEAMKRSLTTNH